MTPVVPSALGRGCQKPARQARAAVTSAPGAPTRHRSAQSTLTPSGAYGPGVFGAPCRCSAARAEVYRGAGDGW